MPSLFSSVAACSSRSRSRAISTSRAPCRPSSAASARPRPLLPPVITTPLPLQCMAHLLTYRRMHRLGRRLARLLMHWRNASVVAMSDELSGKLGANLAQLREARGLTHEQIAKLAGVPRATWTNLESGAANPTLAVLYRVAQALQVPLEELIATPRAAVAHYPAGTLPVKERGQG